MRERERARARISGGGAEREGDTESEAGPRSKLSAHSPDVGLKLADRKLMT